MRGYTPVLDDRSDFTHGVVSPEWCQDSVPKLLTGVKSLTGVQGWRCGMRVTWALGERPAVLLRHRPTVGS